MPYYASNLSYNEDNQILVNTEVSPYPAPLLDIYARIAHRPQVFLLSLPKATGFVTKDNFQGLGSYMFQKLS